MPASNYLTYYAYPEQERAKNSLIFALDSEQDNIPDHVERLHNMNPHVADTAPPLQDRGDNDPGVHPGLFGPAAMGDLSTHSPAKKTMKPAR